MIYQPKRGGSDRQSIMDSLMSGASFNQQSRHNSSVNKALEQRIKRLDREAEDQLINKAKDELNEATYNAELGGPIKSVVDVMDKYPNVLKDKGPDGKYLPFNITRITYQDLTDKFGSAINPKLTYLNESDMEFTEEDLANPDIMFEKLSKVYHLSDTMKTNTGEIVPDERAFSIMQFEEGNSNYRLYKRKRQQEEALINSQIGKNNRSNINKEAVKSELSLLTDLRNQYLEGTIPKEDVPKYNILKEKFNMSKPYAEQLINAPHQDEKTTPANELPLNQQVDMHTSKKSWNPAAISPSTISLLKQAEFDTGREFKGRDNINTDISSLSTVVDLRNNILRNDSVASGMVENAMVDLSKLTSDPEFQEMSKEEQAKHLNTTEMRARVGNTTNALLKALSGADVTEDQYNRVIGQLLGGDIENVNLSTISAALGGTADSMYNKLTGDVSNISSRETPGTKAELAYNLYQAYNSKATDLAEKRTGLSVSDNTGLNQNIKSTGDNTISDAAGEGIANTVTDATSAGFDLLAKPVQGLVRAFTEPAIDYMTDTKKEESIDSAFNAALDDAGISDDEKLKADTKNMTSEQKVNYIANYLATTPGMQELLKSTGADTGDIISYIGSNPQDIATDGNVTSPDNRTTLENVKPQAVTDYVNDTSTNQQLKDLVDAIAAIGTGGGVFKIGKGLRDVSKGVSAKKAEKLALKDKVTTANAARKEELAAHISDIERYIKKAKIARKKSNESASPSKDETRLWETLQSAKKDASLENMTALQQELRLAKEADSAFGSGAISTVLNWIF